MARYPIKLDIKKIIELDRIIGINSGFYNGNNKKNAEEQIKEIVSKNKKKNITKNKAMVIYLRNIGKDIATICDIVKLSKRTVINYIVSYSNTSDIKKTYFFHENNYEKSELEKNKMNILQEFDERYPITYKEATSRIEKLFNIKRSETQVRYFLRKHKRYSKYTWKINKNEKNSRNKKIRETDSIKENS
ncbi:MAG: hypothetical protein PHG03_04430 [Bacilli bacterium]|nr:hypothetical protein [Bacilli bacterium]MDD4795784.1 hypothetical protein [Bacilli bacterium]